ncbi:MAG: hypothetical protein JNM34_09920 [Chthonomonadaceae bacterium]|nr:hypothetical protein [Chthonomonadaceae bacterium]
MYLEKSFTKLNNELQPQFQQALKRRDTAKTLKQRNAAQAEVDRIFDAMHPPTAYFRDSYNNHCLLSQLCDSSSQRGLSWWRDVAPRLTTDDHLPLGDVQWLLDEVRNRRLTCQTLPTYEQQVTREVMAQVAGGSVQVDQRFAYTADDVEWFVSRKQALIIFLKTALDLATPPVCSL